MQEGEEVAISNLDHTDQMQQTSAGGEDLLWNISLFFFGSLGRNCETLKD